MAPYIARFLDSLLEQTYKRLEIILVNDGATDDTGAVIESYIPRLEAEGYRVLYLVQENGGPSSAINTGLKHVHGEFLAWPDSDDWLTPDAIEKKVNFLREHPEAGMVRGNLEHLREEDGASLRICESVDGEPYVIEDFAKKLLLATTWYGALACLARMACFLKVNPQREIYVTRKGPQNIQIMAPLAWHYPCWQLPEVQGYYLIRSSSHSHKARTVAERMNYIDMVENIALHVLPQCVSSEEELVEMTRVMCQQYDFERFKIAIRGGDKKLARVYYPRLKGYAMKRGMRLKMFLRTYIFPW